MQMNNWIARARAALLGLAVLASGGHVFAQEHKADAVVRQALQEGRDLPVIVRFANDAAVERGKQVAKAERAAIKRSIKSLRALGIKANRQALLALLADDSVVRISYDAPVTGSQLTTATAGVSIESSGSRVARTRYKVTGSGIAVAVIDSGVQPHADLPATRIRAFVDYVNGQALPYDDYGHGTHVAGIVAGNGSASSGAYAGAAPGANIVGLKVLNSQGAGSTSNVLAALDWVLRNHGTYGIRVVNLSLGHPIYEPAATDPMVQMVELLARRGIVVVVSAGNMGRNSLGQTVYGSITSPGNAPSAITVGATMASGTVKRSDDAVAAFSSRGPTRYDYYAKPDVVAPGHHIVSLTSPDSYLEVNYSQLKIGSSYFRLNGTSMAAPVVAGAAALVLQANPRLSAAAVKGVIQFTSQRMASLDLMTQGAGALNIPGAVRLASMVNTTSTFGTQWVRASRRPIAGDLLFGEAVYWGRAIVWGKTIYPTNTMFMNLAQWYDNIVWGSALDNIVWGNLDNIVWGNLDNIVWGSSDNIVWGLTDDNIVWGHDDNIVWGNADNIVWGNLDNIVWGLSNDSVMAFSDLTLMGMSDNTVEGESILVGGDQ